jgi:hypothetical protein
MAAWTCRGDGRCPVDTYRPFLSVALPVMSLLVMSLLLVSPSTLDG